MENKTTEIHADADDTLWPGWGPCRHFKDLEPSRELPVPGSSVELRVKCPTAQERVLAIVFQAPVPRATVDALQLHRGGQQYRFHFRSEVPYLAYAFFPQKDATSHASTTGLRLVVDGAAPHGAAVSYVAAMALPGMRSSQWLSPAERLCRLLPGRTQSRTKIDFPYSHFDGTEYLEKNPDVKYAMLARRCPSALYHFLKFGRKEGRRLPLATRSTPNPGSLLNLANHLRTQSHTYWQASRESREESELHLLQLQRVQEELEQYFLENRTLQEAQGKHAEERDALKKTVSDGAMRIAELEAQVADQAERQRKIDEEMIKVEGQLDVLKDFLRPNFV
jgi:hypothetical protein